MKTLKMENPHPEIEPTKSPHIDIPQPDAPKPAPEQAPVPVKSKP